MLSKSFHLRSWQRRFIFPIALVLKSPNSTHRCFSVFIHFYKNAKNMKNITNSHYNSQLNLTCWKLTGNRNANSNLTLHCPRSWQLTFSLSSFLITKISPNFSTQKNVAELVFQLLIPLAVSKPHEAVEILQVSWR